MFDPQQYLDQHGGDPLAALRALAAERDTQQAERDREGQAAARARRERDEARARAQQLDEQVQELSARVPAEGSVTLTPEQAQQWQAVQERGGLAAWDADREGAQQGQQFRQEALLTRLAAAQGWSPERLAKLLAGRTLDEREVTPEGGPPTRVIGLVSGETFTPAVQEFAEFAPALSLTPTQPPAPSWPRQDPVGGPAPATPQQLDAERAGSGLYTL